MLDIEKIKAHLELKKLLNTYKCSNENADFTPYSPVYLETNELLPCVVKELELANKDVCCVTGSGDFALNALALGAKKVVTFDINHYAKYLLALKAAAIKTYPRRENYQEFFLKEASGFLDYNSFLEVKKNLDTKNLIFWEEFYRILRKKNISPKENDFFRISFLGTLTMQEHFNIYFDDIMYQNLRRNLFRREIISYDMDITSLPTLKEKYQFDVIYLSNILQYYRTIPGLETPSEVHLFLEKLKKDLLSSSGVIGVDYCYWRNLIEFYSEFSEHIGDIANYLILKYPDIYELKDIPGIFPETEDGLCLTRKRRKSDNFNDT